MAAFPVRVPTSRVPTSRPKHLRRYARAAKIVSYVAPALATVLLFFARTNAVWLWWAAAILIVSIGLQITKDWWEKILKARREPDARALDITLAQFALTSTSLVTRSGARKEALSLCRRYILQALAREYEDWEGSIATLYLLAVTEEPDHISVEVGDAGSRKRIALTAALEAETQPQLVVNGDSPRAKSFVAVPVRFDGVTRGIVTLQTSEEYRPTGKDIEIVQKYSDMLAITFQINN